MSRFIIGDKVRVKPEYVNSHLKADYYVVQDVDYVGCVLVGDNPSSYQWWAEERFVLVGQVEDDLVNHPPHYTSHPSGVECIEITEHLDFCIGNAIKYLWRAGLKGEAKVEDMKKAIWYINRKIELVEKENG